MLVLLDIQKAFDSISWSFIKEVLQRFQFPPNFVRWFEIFYTNKELRIINHGYLSESIHPSRGVAQGCGISPLFFILGMEVLALAIRNCSDIKGISCGNTVKKVSMLADDSLLALQWDNRSFAAVTNILKNFQVVSNLAINESKSLIVPIGHNPWDRTPLDQTAGFPILQGALFEHLGVWFSTTRVKGRIEHMIPQWDSELNKIKAAIELRDNRHHTLLDRVLTVKSLLVSKLVYKFKSMDSPPTKWLNNLQSILIKYIWSRGPHHMTASKTFLPIEQGGLNMINVHWQEKSLKLAWFQKAQDNPELYWVQYLHSCLTIDFKTFIVSNIARNTYI